MIFWREKKKRKKKNVAAEVADSWCLWARKGTGKMPRQDTTHHDPVWCLHQTGRRGGSAGPNTWLAQVLLLFQEAYLHRPSFSARSFSSSYNVALCYLQLWNRSDNTSKKKKKNTKILHNISQYKHVYMCISHCEDVEVKQQEAVLATTASNDFRCGW